MEQSDKEMDMRMKILVVAALTLAAFATLGFSCINENFVVSINVEGISGVYDINPGSGSFSECTDPVGPDTYLGAYNDATIRGARIYDVLVSTIGTYSGNVTGTATVNGVPILAFDGPFSYFNTPRSLRTDTNITRFDQGIKRLVDAITAGEFITVCGSGQASPGPFPTGQMVKVEVLGQVDAEP
jgi:hypothetical protein